LHLWPPPLPMIQRSYSLFAATYDPQVCTALTYSEYLRKGPPLRSSGQSSWLLTQRSRVRFLALPDFLSSSGSGMGSTQPLERLERKVAPPV
jgi:hypothetical protein